MRLALFLILVVLILPMAEGLDKPLEVIPASEILAKIEKGEIVEEPILNAHERSAHAGRMKT